MSSRVARRLRKLELLYIAALYHDIGKGRGGDHSELGAVDAERFCREHGLDEKDTELVVWLVRNHLVMSAVSQRKDISDPEIIQQFAEHVGDQEHLDYLFTLTVADINGTNPTLWNAWRGSLLRQLYTETRRALRRGLDNPVDKQALGGAQPPAPPARFSRTAVSPSRNWTSCGRSAARITSCGNGPRISPGTPRPLPATTIATSRWCWCATTESRVANTTQIFIHARSHAQLFSQICAELEQLDLSVHDARIYNANDGMSLDTFYVLDSSGQPIAEDGTRLKFIKEHLTEALSGNPGAPQIVQRRTPRRVKSFSIPTETSMSVDEVKHVSVLEVSTPDRPGSAGAYRQDLCRVRRRTAGRQNPDPGRTGGGRVLYHRRRPAADHRPGIVQGHTTGHLPRTGRTGRGLRRP